MTRTVEQARRWPMPGDEWKTPFGLYLVLGIAHTENGPIVILTNYDGPMLIEQFRFLLADAIPVRIFEGES